MITFSNFNTNDCREDAHLGNYLNLQTDEGGDGIARVKLHDANALGGATERWYFGKAEADDLAFFGHGHCFFFLAGDYGGGDYFAGLGGNFAGFDA